MKIITRIGTRFLSLAALGIGRLPSSLQAGLLRAIRRVSLSITAASRFLLVASENRGNQVIPFDIKKYSCQYTLHQRITGNFLDITHRQFMLPAGDDTLSLILENVSKNSLFIDVGANIGYYTLIAARRVATKNIYCFEANPNIFELLINNLRRNGFDTINAHQIGLSNQEGLATYFSSPHSSGGASFERSYFPNSVSVNISPFDVIGPPDLSEYSDIFVKIDTEGHDFHVIQGMKTLWNSSKDKIISIEVRPHTIDDIVAFFVDYDIIPFHQVEAKFTPLSAREKDLLKSEMQKLDQPRDLYFTNVGNSYLHLPKSALESLAI
jgi:FkbM family methyltransferase